MVFIFFLRLRKNVSYSQTLILKKYIIFTFLIFLRFLWQTWTNNFINILKGKDNHSDLSPQSKTIFSIFWSQNWKISYSSAAKDSFVFNAERSPLFFLFLKFLSYLFLWFQRINFKDVSCKVEKIFVHNFIDSLTIDVESLQSDCFYSEAAQETKKLKHEVEDPLVGMKQIGGQWKRILSILRGINFLMYFEVFRQFFAFS